MPGPIALIGGEEFSEGFEDVHAALMQVASSHSNGKRPLRAVYLPFNAADDGLDVVECWSAEAQMRLGETGASVSAPLIIDHYTADDPANAAAIYEADWIYIGGGKPQVGMRILSGTRSQRALIEAYNAGALIAGASAGAMILCSHSWVITDELDRDIEANLMAGRDREDWILPILSPLTCLGILPRSLVWPHFNQFFSLNWLKQGLKPDGCTVIGIDEQTAVLSNGDGSWQVLGRGTASLIDNNYTVSTFQPGSTLLFPA